MFTKIVWATDGSEHADRALEYATKIAKSESAELHAAELIEKLVGGCFTSRRAPYSRCLRWRPRRVGEGQRPHDGFLTAGLGLHVADP